MVEDRVSLNQGEDIDGLETSMTIKKRLYEPWANTPGYTGKNR
jgi:hypothetical protein